MTVISHSCHSVPAQKGWVMCHSAGRQHGTEELGVTPVSKENIRTETKNSTESSTDVFLTLPSHPQKM